MSSSLRFYASWTDAALLEALAMDNRGAFAEIYERYWYRVFALAYRKLKSRETAEELVQELFATLWHKRTQQTIEQLEHYLLVAINRRVIGYIRAHRIRTHYADYCRNLQVEETHETEDTLAVADLSAAFLRGVEQLPEKSREVFRLSRLEHQSVEEIATRLDVTPKAVEYHLTKSLKLLRTYLREFLVALLPLLFFIR
ncbi:RNA polymerase sigma factor [Hymenobacter volaticus]|uniref:RNA polymerase sigma-70 factor n=1 Tax=Hymenobacter volaticus TaxID=2932254 RepID=A0ABY4GFB6_9BACT|nr:RNA polymerase sigma-70 factor [Hymenobacter volaticus]UOQ69625.1 RNA polymerase sigma-70 factor [Hymenobacter volaticus]